MNKRVSGSKQGVKDAQGKQNAGGKQGSPNTQAKANAGGKQGSPNTQAKANAGGKPASQSGQEQTRSASSNRQAARRATMQAAKQQQRLEEQKIEKRTRLITLFSIIGAVIVVAAVIVGVIYYNQSGNQTETVVNPSYPPVDGIYCDTLEQTAYHVHAHVTIWINGKQSLIPQYTGIASDGSCYYWLHTHDTTGVIHMEAPASRSFIFGNFLDEWSAHFSSLGYPPELDFTTGWKVWVDGKPYTGNFRNIPLVAHALITMAYDSPGVKPDTTYAWNGL